MVTWLPFALIAIIGYLGFNISLKIGGMTLHPLVFSTILYVGAFFFQIIVFSTFYFLKRPAELLPATGTAVPVIAALCAGLSVMVIDISMTYMISKGGSIALGFPLVYVCQLAFTAAIGVAFFGEAISAVNVVGIFLGLAGVAMILYR